ncbi:hypothetical protein H4S08_003427 [Coemansia sp. RSA 1365]|nr:hypothetical protein H4S08_003427 [Coemansia sp. RSA 1365]
MTTFPYTPTSRLGDTPVRVTKRDRSESLSELEGPIKDSRITPQRRKRPRSNKSASSKSDRWGASDNTAKVTPHSIRTGHINATTNLMSTMSEIQEERAEEARFCVEKHFTRDDSNVLNISRPRDRVRARLADKLSMQIYNKLEDIVRPHKLGDPESINKPNISHRTRFSTRTARASSQKLKSPLSTTRPTLTNETHQDYLSWIHMTQSNGKNAQKESEMYSKVAAFIQFVADELSKKSDSKMTKLLAKSRSIVSCSSFDINADGADDYTRIDMALTNQATIKEGAKPRYRDMIAIVEVKRSQEDQDSAFHQLFMYTRNIYANQFNRRFAWGLTVCGTFVCACLFLHDNIRASNLMDVSTPAGRKAFVSLLVNWSICEEERLGYDPTIRYNTRDRHWEIDAFDKDVRGKRTYICDSIIQDACSVFGRHTRCFTATLKCEQSADGDLVSSRADKVLIKDAWAHVAKGSIRDEVAYLYEIRQKLGGDKSLEGTYPYLEAGAVVRINGTSNRYAEDTTQHILQGTNGNMPEVQREHRRLVMSPIGEPLQSVNSVDELIVVAYDAMAAHTAILKHCAILHRDISINNILVCRGSSGIGGMLIDFDNAIHVGDYTGTNRPDRTGTLPYMSICNLKESDIKRTALDDWESLIYILCWLGTIGVNRNDQSESVNMDQLQISSWKRGNADVIAAAKKVHMTSLATLNNGILCNFRKLSDYEHLGELVASLYCRLFDNTRVSLRSRGCGSKKFSGNLLNNMAQMTIVPDGGFIDEGISSEITDPFARRAEIADELSKDLLAVLKLARDNALERIAYQSV